MKTRTVTMILCAALVALGALTGARAAQQRVNANSNTERGGADVRQVPGKKIGTIKTAGNHHSPRARRGRHSAEPVRPRQAHHPLHARRGRIQGRKSFASVGRGDRHAASGQRRPPHEVPVSVLRQELGRDDGDGHGPDLLRWWLQRPRAGTLRPSPAGRSRHRQQDSSHRRVPQAADDRHALRERARRPRGHHVGHERAHERAAGRDVHAHPAQLSGRALQGRPRRSVLPGDDRARRASWASTPCRPAARRRRRPSICRT